jgi:hypothetical protein
VTKELLNLKFIDIIFHRQCNHITFLGPMIHQFAGVYVTLIGKTRGNLFFEKRLSKTYINSADLQMYYVKFDIHILLTWNCFYNIYKYNNPKQY